MELLCRQKFCWLLYQGHLLLAWRYTSSMKIKAMRHYKNTNIHSVFSSYWTRLWCWSEQLSTNVSVQPESSWLERFSSEKSLTHAVMCKTRINPHLDNWSHSAAIQKTKLLAFRELQQEHSLKDIKTFRKITNSSWSSEYGTFEIRRNDRLRLTFEHFSHAILRNCRALLYSMHRLNQADRI